MIVSAATTQGRKKMITPINKSFIVQLPYQMTNIVAITLIDHMTGVETCEDGEDSDVDDLHGESIQSR